MVQLENRHFFSLEVYISTQPSANTFSLISLVNRHMASKSIQSVRRARPQQEIWLSEPPFGPKSQLKILCSE